MVTDRCTRCDKLIEKPENNRVTVKKYCSAECRDAWWNETRRHGKTWGERCNEQYGVVPELTLTDGEAMWLAAAIDGEGTIGLYREHRPHNKNGYRFSPVVEVFNCNIAFVARAADLMGGFVANKTAATNTNRAGYKASANRRRAIPVLHSVLPYLIIKRRQAELVLEATTLIYGCTTHTSSIYHDLEAIWLEMKALNKRGL